MMVEEINKRPVISEEAKKALYQMYLERIKKRKMISLGKCKSFWEFLIKVAIMTTIEFLAEKGFTRWEAYRYCNFVKFIIAHTRKYGKEYLDYYMDIAEKKFPAEYNLDPEIIKELEFLVIDILNNIPKLMKEYARYKEWYESYCEKIKRKWR